MLMLWHQMTSDNPPPVVFALLFLRGSVRCEDSHLLRWCRVGLPAIADASQTTETAAMTRAITTGQETTALIPALFLVQFITASAAVARDLVFTPRDIAGWETEQFKGPVEYRLVQQDGREALHAVCTGKGASARYLRREIDLRETPILEWSWRIQGTFSGRDERTKAGDDYPVRVYAVVDGGLLGWRTQAVNYVWASARPAGSVWPNAYASQAKMLALQSGSARAAEWITERRDLASDFQRLHGASPAVIHGLAIMTDCDDVGQPMEGWYGEIRVRPR